MPSSRALLQELVGFGFRFTPGEFDGGVDGALQLVTVGGVQTFPPIFVDQPEGGLKVVIGQDVGFEHVTQLVGFHRGREGTRVDRAQLQRCVDLGERDRHGRETEIV